MIKIISYHAETSAFKKPDLKIFVTGSDAGLIPYQLIFESMKTYFYILFFSCAVLVLLGCNSGPTQNSAVNMKTSEKDSTFNICFSSVVKKDTVLLNALMFGDSVKGSLGYKLYEKDHSNGSLLGKMFGDTLKATCTFMVKGAESIQEVVFLKRDSLFVEGLGSRKTDNGKIVFADPEKLHFDGLVLKQASCK